MSGSSAVNLGTVQVRDLVQNFSRQGRRVTLPRPSPLEALRARTASPLSVSIRTGNDLNALYTPGVAQACKAIQADPREAASLTRTDRHIAVVSDGSAILGLGDIGPKAGMPILVGKSRILREFGGLLGVPIALATQNVNQIIATIRTIVPGFGGIMLEDISAPRCFAIEQQLQNLGIPVIHDDQWGTSGVVLAAVINALKTVGKEINDATIIVAGIGAAGYATVKTLYDYGAGNVIAVDKYFADGRPTGNDILHRNLIGQAHVPSHHAQLLLELPNLNRGQIKGTLEDAFRLGQPDIFIGLARGKIVDPAWIKYMAGSPIVFALSNPTPEVDPYQAMLAGAQVVATGRADFDKETVAELRGDPRPNIFQVNNALLFWAFYRGLIEAGATFFDKKIVSDAAKALAALGDPDRGIILPPLFHSDGSYNAGLFHPLVRAVIDASIKYGATTETKVPFDETATDELLLARAQSSMAQDVPIPKILAQNLRKLLSGEKPFVITHSPSIFRDTYSRVTIYAKDEPGLLTKISARLEACGLRIVGHVSVETSESDFRGYRVGVFYVNDGRDNPVLHDEEIRQAVFAQLAGVLTPKS